MNLRELNSGTPTTKKWLKPVCDSVSCTTLNATDIKNAGFSGTTTFNGNVRVLSTLDLIFGNGTQNSFISAVTNIQDERRVRLQNLTQEPVFEICQPNASETLAVPCSTLVLNKNTGGSGGVGLSFYYNGTDVSVPNAGARLNHLCFLFTGSACKFSFFQDNSIRAGNLHYNQGDKAGVGNNGLKILDTTASTSISSGAIQCSGGVGIAGNVHVGGQLTIANHPVGEFFWTNNNTATTITTIATWTAVAGIASTSDITASQFTHNALGRLTYTGTATRQFKITHCGTFIGTSSANVVACVGFMKNGVFLTGAKNCWESVNNDENYTSSVQKITTLSTGDFIELGVINETNTDNIIIRNCNLEIVALF